MSSRQQQDAPPAATSSTTATRRWLLLAHQLPARGSNLRVRTWRRLQQIGAVAVKQGLYVLPDSPGAREDFEWLKTEIKDSRGEATVFVADTVDAWSDDALVEEFRRSRQQSYAALTTDVERVLARLNAPRRKGARGPAVTRALDNFRQRLAAIEHVDFFGSAGRDRVVTLLAQLKTRVSHARTASPTTAAETVDVEKYRSRTWVTRPRPGVDRMASAWLIRRFIDPQARFDFVADRDSAPPDTIPFDMFGVEFTHRADHCTFETLSAVFDIKDAAVNRLAGIVHDLDLKDGRFNPTEGPTVASIIEGLQHAYADDAELLAHGTVLFEALYRSIAHTERPPGPRVLAGSPPVTRRSTRRQKHKVRR